MSGINTTLIKSYSDGIIGVINTILVPVLVAIAFIVFLYGVYKYFILGAASDTERASGRQFVMWGIIGFVIIMSVWALVRLTMGIFGLTSTQSPPFPIIGGSSQTTTGNPTNPTNPVTNNVVTPVGTRVCNYANTYMGTVTANSEIRNDQGQLIGRVQNGQFFTPAGAPNNWVTCSSQNPNTAPNPGSSTITCDTDIYTIEECRMTCVGDNADWNSGTNVCTYP